MASDPRVSIVIPVHNGSDYMREAIDSALAQSWPNVEVIVVNDGSEDGERTDAIARSYGDRIRYIAKENGGVASALNAGIRAMSGDCFSWLSHDDVYCRRKIEIQVARLKREGRDVVLYGDYDLIDAGSRHLATTRVGWMREPDFRMALVVDIPVNGCTVLVPKACFDAAGTFDETLRISQDYDLWFRLAGRYEFVHVPEILVGSRLHPGQGTNVLRDVCRDEGNRTFARFLDAIAADPGPLSPSRVARFFFKAAIRLKRRGYVSASEHALALFVERAGRGAVSAPIRAAALRYYGICAARGVTRFYGLYRRIRAACG
ncbi:MAG: glycosyltransferase [Deltaproteobacteria bacterium]